MGDLDDLLSAIEQLHAAGVDGALWPVALAAIATLVGGVAATLEVLDRRSFAHTFFSAAGVPPPEEIAYLSEYAAMSPRVPAALKQKPGELAWDYQILNETGIDRDPFYANFLAPMDMRYSTASLLKVKPDEFAALAVQRSARQGHVTERELDIMGRLGSHASLALDVMRRLGQRPGAALTDGVFEWLVDAVLVIGRDGRVTSLNRAAETLIRRGDGIALVRDQLELGNSAATQALQGALSALATLSGGLPAAVSDFTAPRRSGAPYTVAMRPAGGIGEALALVFIHDPDAAPPDQIWLLRAAFGLTAAEARLAMALRNGISPEAYAAERGISANTVYTHLRRLKDKCGQSRMVELIHLLNSMQSHIRPL